MAIGTKKAVRSYADQAKQVIALAEKAMLKGQIVDGTSLQSFDHEVFPQDQAVEVEILAIDHKDLKRGLNTQTGKPWEIFQPVIVGVVEGNEVEAPVGIGVITYILENNATSVTLVHTVTENKGKEIHKLILE